MQSVADFVAYLEKENEQQPIEELEHFFNQYGEEITNTEVITAIDQNTAKLKKTEPKFYSITVNPSQHELKHLQSHSAQLKEYTRELMKGYAEAFHREIDGRTVTIDDIKYFAKIEHQRSYKGTDKAIKENQPFYGKIVRLQDEIRQVERGELKGNVQKKQAQIKRLEKEAPYQLNGQMIVQGMAKEGSQSHIHIIVSRKDQSNQYSLSPGSKYKASEVVMNGKTVKRGFHRDAFFKNSEKTFDAFFQYNRNYVETYAARKVFVKNPKHYFATITGLPVQQRAVAFKIIGKAGVNTSLLNIPTNSAQLALKAIKKLKKGFDRAIQSGSIGI